MAPLGPTVGAHQNLEPDCGICINTNSGQAGTETARALEVNVVSELLQNKNVHMDTAQKHVRE